MFRLPSFSIQVQVALARARVVARRNIHLAIGYLTEAHISLDSAIAIVARFFGASRPALA